MLKAFFSKLKESAISIAPITLVIVILALLLGIEKNTFFCFLICVVLLILGMTFFTKGADTAMFSMGEAIGSKLSKSKKIWFILICGFIIGIIVTFAEPDLGILATQVESVNKWVFIGVVSIGVGIMLLLATLRIIYNVKLWILLVASFAVIFILGFFTPSEFLPISFDSGSVTTGNLSVPFILAFGFGLSAVLSGKNTDEGTFGMIALSSIGPIITIMLLSLFLPSTDVAVEATVSAGFANFGEVGKSLGLSLLENLKDVGITLLPILVVFFIFQFSSIRLPKQRIIKILIGVLYTYFGIVIFLTGASIGFIPMGSQIGVSLAQLSYNWVLIPVIAILGFCIVIAEPAVVVLNKNVEKITFGAIKKSRLLLSLAIGVAIASALSIIRVLYDINFLYFIIPIYAIALILTFFTKETFTAIAFDSGGVAAGTMAVSFILPLVSGVCQVVGGDLFTGAFGTISFIAATPILVVEIMGVIYTVATRKQARRMKAIDKKMNSVADKENDVVDFRY